MTEPLDILAVAAHRDDVELTCAGILIRAADHGHRAGVVDLTEGELATRGTVADRAREADEAARIMRLAVRENLRLPDGGIADTDAQRALLAAAIRRLRPRVLVLPYWTGRHPDHAAASALGRSAAFLAGLARFGAGEPHRPAKILHAMAYQRGDPTFIADISGQFERKLEAIRCFVSQFEGLQAAGEVFASGRDLIETVRVKHAYYGSLIQTLYGEPYAAREALRVDDVTALAVDSI
jgi:bacillithiol biosynthesis deacetylase BshB1